VQIELKWLFKRRGVEEIVTDRAIQVTWEGSDVNFPIFSRRLESLCEDCIYVVEFIHE